MKPDSQIELVVIAYPNQWHWVLSLEYINLRRSEGIFVEVLDLSLCGELGWRVKIKKNLKFGRFQNSCIKWLEKNKIKYREIQVVERRKPQIDFTRESILSSEDCGVALNSIVERSGELQVQVSRYENIIVEELVAMNSIESALRGIDCSNFNKVVTVNGRFTKNAAVKKWAKSNLKDTQLLEFGASHQKFEIYSDSPHSMVEVQRKIDSFWREYLSKSDEFYQNEVNRFIESITEKTHAWRTRMIEGTAPVKTSKKRCTFFASTEAEYVGVGDKIEDGNFRNQVESFKALLLALDLKEWEIYLRRHPRHSFASNRDPEQYLWREFENSPNIIVLPPESNVDSIELARSSELSVNYCSSISMELIALGIQNVITLGPAPWNNLIPQQYCPNFNRLQKYLSRKKIFVDRKSILPWIIYTRNFGRNFELFTFNSNKSSWSFIKN